MCLYSTSGTIVPNPAVHALAIALGAIATVALVLVVATNTLKVFAMTAPALEVALEVPVKVKLEVVATICDLCTGGKCQFAQSTRFLQADKIKNELKGLS